MGDRPGSGFLTPVETRRSVRDEIVRQLRALESDLRSRGVCGLSLFGSIARGDAGLDSDIDVIVELDPDAHVDLFDLSGLRIDLSRRLGREIDIVTRHDRMKPRFAEHIRDDEVRVF